MAKNYVQPGKAIDYTNVGTDVIASGAMVVMGDFVGVALTDIHPGKTGTVQIEEIWRQPKKAADVLIVGDKAYWHVADKMIVKAAGAGIVYAGRVMADAGVNAANVAVKLNV